MHSICSLLHGKICTRQVKEKPGLQLSMIQNFGIEHAAPASALVPPSFLVSQRGLLLLMQARRIANYIALAQAKHCPLVAQDIKFLTFAWACVM